MNDKALVNTQSPAAAEDRTLVKNWWISLIICLAAGLVLGGAYFALELKNFPLIKNGEPTFSLSPTLLLWLGSAAVLLIGISTFFMLTTSGVINRPKKEIIENLISLGVSCLLLIMYPLFFYLCALKIVGVIMLGLTIVSLSYTTYRYYNACLLAGSIMCLVTLWLNYLFIISFAYLLL